MKKILLIIFYIFILTLIVPFIVVRICINNNEKEKYINVYVKAEEKVREMEVSQYLKEVVSAEMPAEFEFEALKAQAVAARTYLERKKELNENDEAHKGAVICTDSTHCKAWISEEERRKMWNSEKNDEYWDKISRAVDETEDEILMYKGEIVNAVFHSTSSGKTENSADVWGNDVPYLKSVESEGDLFSPKYKSEFSCSEEEFKNKITEKVENAVSEAELFSDIVRSEAGGIISMKVLGVDMKGTEFRNIFGLNSTNIQFQVENGFVHMSILGYGHGVGMSQYGADYMASQGYNYKDILLKYYQGTELLKK